MVTKQNEKLIGRLGNWKFRSAVKYLEGETEDVSDIVNALANTFGDCGWFEGDMATIIDSCVSNILPADVEE